MKLKLPTICETYLQQISDEERTAILTHVKSPAVVVARIKMLIQKGKIKVV
ncbi:MAG: hypothetical protein HC865_27040 [Cyanobacteria bacterium RU_5_0]|nr:hypothetical protein [Cyanobacteria bacterium RU_5_0]